MNRREKRKALKLDDQMLDKCLKIQGTQYDRKRKFNDAEVADMKAKRAAGWILKDVATFYATTVYTVRRNTDDDFAERMRAYYRDKKTPHTGVDHITPQDRVNYKRDLLKQRSARKSLVLIAQL